VAAKGGVATEVNSTSATVSVRPARVVQIVGPEPSVTGVCLSDEVASNAIACIVLSSTMIEAYEE